jgi:hypothetical protein
LESSCVKRTIISKNGGDDYEKFADGRRFDVGDNDYLFKLAAGIGKQQYPSSILCIA